ncbi:MAG: FAD-dependent oxidoreductase [Desulfurococcales archaeon]|nr:FAD-dependent oxidoreductase [Desulfurococcales archaeon]
MARLVVVGGGAAGMAAASRAKRLNKKLDVTVFEKTRWVSFALCGIPYHVGCIVKRLSDLLYYPPEEFTRKRGIDLRLETEVTWIDIDSKKIHYRELKSGKEGELEFDYLLLATGARSKAPRIWPELNEARNAFYIKHLDTAQEIRDYALRLNTGSRAVIVGAGYVGLELAETLTELGLKVTLVEALDQVAPRTLDPDLAELVKSELESNNVEVITGAPVKEFRISDGRVTSVVTEKGDIAGDLFIVGVGIEPNIELAKSIGLKIGETGAIWTDEYMRTSIDYVYAVGDAVEHKDLVTGRRVWRPFAPVANKQGYVAGSNIAGREAVFPGSVGTSTFKTFNAVVARTGLSKSEAENMGYNVVEAKVNARTKAHYMPGSEPLTLKVVADADTGKLLGAQAVGKSETVLWRINVIASLLTTQATVWDLFATDIGYAPPLAPVWDSLIVAARLLMRTLGEKPKKA